MIISLINNLSNTAKSYNLDVKIFITIYLLSAIPVYLGAFLVLHGYLKNMNFKRLFRLNLGGIDYNENIEIALGLCIFLVGFLLPYIYILFFGHNLPVIVYIIVCLLLSISLLFIFKGGTTQRVIKDTNCIISRKEIIKDDSLTKKAWSIYTDSFKDKNTLSPCQQSIRYFDEFKNDFGDSSVEKYLLYIENNLVGIGLVTNNLSNCTWISNDYFKEQYCKYYVGRKIYYFMGIAVASEYRHKGFAIKILEHIIDDLPKDSAMGFDHSYSANKYIPYFDKLVKQRNSISRRYLDKQVYYIMTFKK